MSKLSNVSCYVTEKISVDSIDISEYITTDNLLQNKKGRVIAEKLPTQKVTRFKKNDILIANIRPYLKKIWQADIDGGASSDVLVVRPNDVIDNNFLYYALTQDSFFEYVMKGSKGTKMPRGDKSQIMDFVIPDLEIDEQIKIGKLLKSIDQKIQINNQINQELEAMAKTLYDYWFVQFDFPDQNGEPYKSSEGKMVYNPELKREIPEGWGVASIRDFESNIITGKTPSRTNSDNFGGEIPFITIGDIRGNTYIYRTSETLTDLGASVQKNKYLPEESLCVSCIATVGEIGFTTEPSHTNQQINSIVFEDETNRYYLYFALKNYFENANASAKTGNTFANMNKEDFSGIKIIFPNKEIKNNFHKITEPYFSQIKCLQGQNQQLTQLRDWLLPMLMNGQVKVE
ncbi:restriction endonuclease subunit S [Streptococcus australis]|uniref:restriction endonuclease subunit S n=1 Tax=Streptococcus australis TaxID=113107 RepID=UPI0039C19B0B